MGNAHRKDLAESFREEVLAFAYARRLRSGFMQIDHCLAVSVFANTEIRRGSTKRMLVPEPSRLWQVMLP